MHLKPLVSPLFVTPLSYLSSPHSPIFRHPGEGRGDENPRGLINSDSVHLATTYMKVRNYGEPVITKAAQKKGCGLFFIIPSFACLKASEGAYPSEMNL